MTDVLRALAEQTTKPLHYMAGKFCVIYIEERPAYCNRGHFLAKIETFYPCPSHENPNAGWPRYYFDLNRAKEEIMAWLKFNDQWTTDDWVVASQNDAQVFKGLVDEAQKRAKESR